MIQSTGKQRLEEGVESTYTQYGSAVVTHLEREGRPDLTAISLHPAVTEKFGGSASIRVRHHVDEPDPFVAVGVSTLHRDEATDVTLYLSPGGALELYLQLGEELGMGADAKLSALDPGQIVAIDYSDASAEVSVAHGVVHLYTLATRRHETRPACGAELDDFTTIPAGDARWFASPCEECFA